MPDSVRNANQIARRHLDRRDIAVFRRDMENAAAFDDKPHFVFVVPVFGTKFIEHRFQIRNVGFDVNYIRRHVTAFRFHLLNLR